MVCNQKCFRLKKLSTLTDINFNRTEKTIDVSKLFKDGNKLFDAYSGKTVTVKNGNATINSNYNIVLLENATNKI